jgi:hypothetical protein
VAQLNPGPDVVRTPESRCLECHARLDALGTADPNVPAQPSPGDLTVCITSGAVMMLADNLTPRGMTDEEIAELTADRETMDDLARLVRRVHLLRHSKS